MRKPILYIFAGLPGSGKSTLSKQLARTLKAAHVRIDTIEQGLRNFVIKDVQGEGYDLAYQVAKDVLSSGCDVIADSVNPIEKTRNAWIEVATFSGADYRNIEVFCSDKKTHRHRLEHRDKEVKNLKPTLWEEVVVREYENWKIPRIQIDTSGKTIDESLKALLSAINL